MEVLRVPPYPIVTTWDVPLANTDYVIYIEDLVDHSIQTFPTTSNLDSKVTHTIPQSMLDFDRRFSFKIINLLGNTVLDSNLDILRPYVDPKTLGSTASEIEEYKMLELVARSIIDSHIVDGFYDGKHIVQGIGQGTDYYPIWEKFNKVLKVYENNVLVYDIEDPENNVYDFGLTLDNSAIVKKFTGDYNRVEQGLAYMPPAYGDLGHIGVGRTTDFPRGWDYIFVLDVGYKVVPPDVEYATKLLIEDMKCGKLDYYKRYVTAYNTDQFRIQFDGKMFDGTGNFIVDKILDKYTMTVTKPGII
jgi:hypothetical protein